jgi:DNA-binding MarR family transcriptional regulator
MGERQDNEGREGGRTRRPREAPAIGDQELLERIFGLSRRIQALRRPSPEGLLLESEFLVLAALAQAGPKMMTMKELSERAGIPPSLVSRHVKGLEERKRYVERLPSREDRRQVHIRLTPEGERTLRNYIRRRIERLRPIVHELDDEERQVVWRSVDIFEAILERIQP